MEDFSEGLAPYWNGLITEESGCGYINKKGKTVISFKYDYAFSFCDGLACVMKNGKSYMIDKKGKTITIKQ